MTFELHKKKKKRMLESNDSHEEINNEYEKDLIALTDSKTENKSLIEEKISKHLDDYLENCGEQLMQLPMKSLINIFNNKSRLLKNQNLAYQLIIQQSKTKKSTDLSMYCLLPYLDAKELDEKSVQESHELLKERNFMTPKNTLIKLMQNRTEEKERSKKEPIKKHDQNKNRRFLIFIIVFFIVALLIVFGFYSMRVKIAENEKIIKDLNESVVKLQTSVQEMKEKLKKLELKID